MGGRFHKGQSGNPGGRPKSNLNKLLAEFAAQNVKGTNDTYASLIVKRVFKMALDGDLDAAEFIWDRLEGKVSQPMELGGSDGAPIKFTLALGDGEKA